LVVSWNDYTPYHLDAPTILTQSAQLPRHPKEAVREVRAVDIPEPA
jgi:hypothetical protein